MSANVETMFSVRETPWHGMGTIIHDAPNSADAIKIAGLDWKVEQTPAFVNINGVQTPTGHTINYRDSDNKILGIVKDQYKVVQNDEAFEFTDELIGGDVHYETAGSLSDGKLVWMLAQMPEKSLLGDKVQPYMLFSNSHDGSSSVRVTMTDIRVVCQNTLSFALANARRTWSFVHKGDIKSKLDNARNSLANASKYQTELEKEAERLVKIHYTRQEVQDILNALFPVVEGDDEVTQRKLRNMETLRDNFIGAMKQDDIQQFKGTAWGILQAATDFAYHTRPLRLTENFQDNRMKQAINGNPFVDLAYKLVAVA